ncbi:MAG: hypothetical protein AAGF71_10030 [Pseudomonadota bacterium]
MTSSSVNPWHIGYLAGLGAIFLCLTLAFLTWSPMLSVPDRPAAFTLVVAAYIPAFTTVIGAGWMSGRRRAPSPLWIAMTLVVAVWTIAITIGFDRL